MLNIKIDKKCYRFMYKALPTNIMTLITYKRHFLKLSYLPIFRLFFHIQQTQLETGK